MATSIRFKVGMTVLINSNKTGIGDNVTSYGYEKGDRVELIRYDSSDETWRVKKADCSSIWIKRRNLALLPVVQPTPNATEPKTMKAVCIEPGNHYKNRLTIGITYDVQETDPIGDYPFFKVLNPDGRGGPISCWQSRFRVITETKTPTAVEPKKRMAVCIDMSESTGDYQVGMTYEITRECADYFYLNNKPGGMYKWRFKEIIEPAVQTPTPFKVGDLVRLVRFESAIYDKDYYMKQDNLTIGDYYEVRSIGNNGRFAANTFIDLKDKTYSHPIDCFELGASATAPTSEYTIKVVCNDNSGYEGKLTIGKTYMAKLNSGNDREETARQNLYDIESDDNGTSLTTAYCRRFTVVTPPKVGDTISAQWLNDGTPKQFHGYRDGNSWGSKVVRCFDSDRKIEKIEMRDGRMAALIAGTFNIWIDMAELTKPTEVPGKKHVIPDIAKEIPAPVMGMFLMELSTLIQKYK